MQLEKGEDSRNEGVFRPRIYADRNAAERISIDLMGYSKGKSSLLINEKYQELRYKYRNLEFWCQGYHVDTVGKNAKDIEEHIYHKLEEGREGE